MITGVTGQDGSYLAEYLLGLGYQVWGMIRGQANPRKSRISKLMADLSAGDRHAGLAMLQRLTLRARRTAGPKVAAPDDDA